MNAVVIGDLEQARKAIAKAEVAGAPEKSLRALDGIALFLSGDIGQSIESLNIALQRNPDDLNAKSILYWAYFNALLIDQLHHTGHDLSPIVLGSLTDADILQSDFERVFAALPLICFDNGREIDRVIHILDEIIERHDRWGIAYSIRSVAWLKQGALTENLECLHAALDDHNRAQALVPDSRYVDANGLLACVTAIRLAQAQGLDSQAWKTEAEEVLPLLDGWSYFLPNATRMAYLRATDQNVQADRLEAELLQGAAGNIWIQGAMLFEQERFTEVEELMAANPEQLGSREMWAIALADKSKADLERALQMFRAIIRDNEEFLWTRLHKLDIPLILGKEEVAIEECRRISARRNELFHYWDRYTLEYLLGEIDESEYLRRAGPLYYYDAFANYWVGVRALARGQKLKAKEHFGRIRGIGAFGYPTYHWGNAFHARLERDPDWPPWIPTNETAVQTLAADEG